MYHSNSFQAPRYHKNNALVKNDYYIFTLLLRHVLLGRQILWYLLTDTWFQTFWKQNPRSLCSLVLKISAGWQIKHRAAAWTDLLFVWNILWKTGPFPKTAKVWNGTGLKRPTAKRDGNPTFLFTFLDQKCLAFWELRMLNCSTLHCLKCTFI